MQVPVRRREQVTILEPAGQVTSSGGDEALRRAVLEAVGGTAGQVLINLESVDFIDSSGVGELIAAHTTLSKRGGTLKLLKLSPKVHDVLQIAQLFTVFEVFDDEDEAIASFR
jgi:anti-sigma B factor antagonist